MHIQNKKWITSNKRKNPSANTSKKQKEKNIKARDLNHYPKR